MPSCTFVKTTLKPFAHLLFSGRKPSQMKLPSNFWWLFKSTWLLIQKRLRCRHSQSRILYSFDPVRKLPTHENDYVTDWWYAFETVPLCASGHEINNNYLLIPGNFFFNLLYLRIHNFYLRFLTFKTFSYRRGLQTTLVKTLGTLTQQLVKMTHFLSPHPPG